MSEFETQIEVHRENAVVKLRKWQQEQSAKEVMRDYLSEEGMYTKSDTKLAELLDERHRIALNAEDDNTRLKAIDSAIASAAGSEKVGNVQNNQFNFGDFLDKI